MGLRIGRNCGREGRGRSTSFPPFPADSPHETGWRAGVAVARHPVSTGQAGRPISIMIVKTSPPDGTGPQPRHVRGAEVPYRKTPPPAHRRPKGVLIVPHAPKARTRGMVRAGVASRNVHAPITCTRGPVQAFGVFGSGVTSAAGICAGFRPAHLLDSTAPCTQPSGIHLSFRATWSGSL